MVLRQRAIQEVDKLERRNAILDAADRLLADNPERIVSMAEVATAASLAKGTMYLYFPSKEELLLALHERHGELMFEDMFTLLEGPGPVGFDEVFAIVRRHMVDGPTYLPLASLCFGLMERGIPPEAGVEFKARVAQQLQRAGAGLENHFPSLNHGDGVALLMHSYALTVGLWQMLHPRPGFDEMLDARCGGFFPRDYADQLERGLRSLWAGRTRLAEDAHGVRS